MGTSFFHESNFQGLIEKVRERGRASATQRMTEQINRLFSTSENEAGSFSPVANSAEENAQQQGGLKNDSTKAEVTKPNKSNPSNKDLNNKDGGPCNVESDILSSKEAILSSTATLSENLANLSLSQGYVISFSECGMLVNDDNGDISAVCIGIFFKVGVWISAWSLDTIYLCNQL